ncbi:MAG TPA: sugar transferase [Cytophagaceae bacterium]|nr:sugar transferase [Cytophagaceae bacterium]
MYKRFFKRAFDILGAIFLLLFFLPFTIVIMIVLFFSNKGKIFFTQLRPGKEEKPFLLYKFRTMKDDVPEEMSERERISGFGNILRKTSLDEIPQLIHVLEGKMSIIGPRPLLMEYLPLYSEVQRKRHSVLPGITGWAQVKGRNSISWKDRFELDVYYAENFSFGLDFKIVLLTFVKVILAKDIYDKNGQIVEKFKGEL